MSEVALLAEIDLLKSQLEAKDNIISAKDQKIGILRNKLEERDKVILIVKVRSRIEELEIKFLTPQTINTATRRQKWSIILSDQSLTSVELQQFRASVAVPPDVFIDTVVGLYGDFSDVAAHKVWFTVPATRVAIEDMFRDLGITPDEAKIRTVETLVSPILLP